MNKLDDAALAALKERNPTAELIEDDSIGLFVVLRVPTRMEWKTYRSESAEAETRYTGQMKLIGLIALYPTSGEIAVYFEQKPAAVESITRKISEIAGISASRYQPPKIVGALERYRGGNLEVGSDALLALFRGEKTDEADLGAVILAEALRGLGKL